MLEKKLLTLACAAGILACGACFLPPLPERPTPPPPLRLDLHGVRNIRVNVTDASDPRHIDSYNLALQIANEINLTSKQTKVRAHVPLEKGPGDAELEVTLLSEEVSSAEPSPGWTGPQSLEFTFRVSACLKKTDGQIIWDKPDTTYKFHRVYPEKDPQDAWSDPAMATFIPLTLSTNLVYRMLYGDN